MRHPCTRRPAPPGLRGGVPHRAAAAAPAAAAILAAVALGAAAAAPEPPPAAPDLERAPGIARVARILAGMELLAALEHADREAGTREPRRRHAAPVSRAHHDRVVPGLQPLEGRR